MTPIAELVQSNAVSWLFIPSAILLGALHALEPGHSKTMMAAFIVAIRGTFRHAALLAVTATISHTAVVWLVAILALTYGSQYSAEASEPYFQLISAAIILGVAIWMLARTYRDQQAAKRAAAHTHRSIAPEEITVIDTKHGEVLSLIKDGTQARFRLNFTDKQGHPKPPSPGESFTVETTHDDGLRETFELKQRGDILEAVAPIPEPHQFTVSFTIEHHGHTHKHEARFPLANDHAHDHRHEHPHDSNAHDETKVIDTGRGVAELSIYEDGVAPRFRMRVRDFRKRDGTSQPPPPAEKLTVETIRDNGTRQKFEFKQQDDFLESMTTIPEPHQFTAVLSIAHANHTHTYEMHFVESDHGDDHAHHHDHDHTHDHGHAHQDAHGHDHQHEHGHDHAHDHGDGHSHASLDVSSPGFQDAHERAHAREIQQRFANRNVTTGQIALFGLTGGLLPCPAAIIVLILCLQLQNFWLGMVLVLCFSIGLALTLLASGMVASWGVRHASRRWPGFDTFMRRAPYLASAVIIVIGLYVGYQGVTALA